MLLRGKITDLRDLGAGTNLGPAKELNVRMEPMSFGADRIEGRELAVELDGEKTRNPTCNTASFDY